MTLDTTSWPMLAGHGRPPPKTWESDEAKAIARRDAKPNGSEKREGQVSSKNQMTELPLDKHCGANVMRIATSSQLNHQLLLSLPDMHYTDQ